MVICCLKVISFFYYLFCCFFFAVNLWVLFHSTCLVWIFVGFSYFAINVLVSCFLTIFMLKSWFLVNWVGSMFQIWIWVFIFSNYFYFYFLASYALLACVSLA